MPIEDGQQRQRELIVKEAMLSAYKHLGHSGHELTQLDNKITDATSHDFIVERLLQVQYK